MAIAFGIISPKIRITTVRTTVFNKLAKVGLITNLANRYPAIDVLAMLTKLLKVNMHERAFSKFSTIYIAFLAPLALSSANVFNLKVLLELYAVSLELQKAEQKMSRIIPTIENKSPCVKVVLARMLHGCTIIFSSLRALMINRKYLSSVVNISNILQ